MGRLSLFDFRMLLANQKDGWALDLNIERATSAPADIEGVQNVELVGHLNGRLPERSTAPPAPCPESGRSALTLPSTQVDSPERSTSSRRLCASTRTSKSTSKPNRQVLRMLWSFSGSPEAWMGRRGLRLGCQAARPGLARGAWTLAFPSLLVSTSAFQGPSATSGQEKALAWGSSAISVQVAASRGMRQACVRSKLQGFSGRLENNLPAMMMRDFVLRTTALDGEVREIGPISADALRKDMRVLVSAEN